MHRVAHGSERLIWLYDLHLLLEGLSQRETSEFAEAAKEKRVWTLCARSIALTRSRFRTRVQPVLRHELEEATSCQGVELSAYYVGTPQWRLQFIDFSALSSWRERLQWASDMAFPTRKFMAKHYPNCGGIPLPVLYCWRLGKGTDESAVFLRRYEHHEETIGVRATVHWGPMPPPACGVGRVDGAPGALAPVVASCSVLAGVPTCPEAVLVRHPLEVDRLVWAVEHVSVLVPGARCLTQAATVQFLLRRTSEPSCLRIGVAKDPNGRFIAHAWVESRGKPLIGETQAADFKPLLRVRSSR